MSEPSGSGGEAGEPHEGPEPEAPEPAGLEPAGLEPEGLKPEGLEPEGTSLPLSRLDPDRAAGVPPPQPPAAQSPEAPSKHPSADQATLAAGQTASSKRQARRPADRPAPVIVDNRRYRWMIGIIGLVLVVVVSIYQFATHGVGTTGVPAGQRLHLFAAPLADTNLEGTPNTRPTCSLARHDPRALNVCLLVRQAPLVLAFFVTGSGECVHEVDALQALSREFPASEVRFAAVAIQASHHSVASLVRSRHWTIPVAYDSDGSIGGLYGVAVCPMAELAYRGGIVQNRLIGEQWQTSAELAPTVRALVRAQRARDAG